MTQEEKELLLKDLCARLPYGTICRCRTTEDSTWWNTDHYIFGITGGKFDVGSDILDAEQLKPYLRPMSSMTEEEVSDLFGVMFPDNELIGYEIEKDKIRFRSTNKEKQYNPIVLFFNRIYCLEQLDWLNAHHFDFRGLIEKGLAIEAPEGMYKIE